MPDRDILEVLREAARVYERDVGPDHSSRYLMAADEIDRLRKIEAAARALQFGAYPAHGSGFVIIVSGGNIDHLKSALGGEGTEIIRPGLRA